MGAGSGGVSDSHVVDGIVQKHAYAVIDVVEEDGFQLVCLRNPWGMGEWQGKFSDAWLRKYGSSRLKYLLRWEDRDDGVFYMAFSDMLKYFDNVYICKLFPTNWFKASVRSEWKGITAGGAPGDPTWHHNPQFLLTLDRKCHLFVCAVCLLCFTLK